MTRRSKDVIAQAEGVVRRALVDMVSSGQRECLACYLQRVVSRFGCDGKLRWTHRWQGDQRVRNRRTGGLTAWLRSRGGYCDCEVLANVYRRDGIPEADSASVPPCEHGPVW